MSRARAIFTLDSELIRELGELSAELATTRSGLVEQSLLFYFDYLDVKLAEKRLADAGDEVVSAEKVFEELGL